MIELSEFSKLALPEVLHCPSVTLDFAVRQVIIDFAMETWIFKKSFSVTVTTSDIDSTLNDSADINVGEYVTDKLVVAIDDFKINGVTWNLKYLELENSTNYMSYLRDTGTKVFSFPDNGTVRVHEMTNGDELFFTVIYKPTFDILEVDDELYNDWAEVIVAGVKGKLMTIPDKPWSDPKMAGYYKTQYRRGVSKARRVLLSDYTGVSSHVNWRSFGE
jgi:hypothetical protein